jgi:hypothetical protein
MQGYGGELSGRRIVLIECIKEADSYLGGKIRDGHEDTVIAMNPSCYCYLKAKGADVINTSGLFDNSSHCACAMKSDEITKWLRKELVFPDAGTGVTRAFKDMFIYWARFAVHKCLWISEIVSRAESKYKPDIICASVSGAVKLNGVLGLYLEPQGKYMGRIAKAFAESNGLVFEDLPYDSRKDVAGQSSFGIVVRFIMQYARFELWKYRTAIRQLFKGKRKVYITTQNYNFNVLYKRLRENLKMNDVDILRGVAVPYLRVPEWLLRASAGRGDRYFRESMQKLRVLSRMIGSDRELFSYKGVFFGDIIAEKIEDSLADYILGLMLWSMKMDRFIAMIRPKAFISNGNRADDEIVAEICNKRGIPMVMISHGSHVRPRTEAEKIEWGEHGMMLLRGPYNRLALQSPLAEEYLEEFPTQAFVLKTGPLVWGLPAGKVDRPEVLGRLFGKDGNYRDSKVIVHAGTPKTSKSLRFTVYETPDEYLKGIVELAEAVEALPGAVLIVKFRPSPDISADDIRSIVPFSGKVVLSIEEPFLDVLAVSDLLVSFSSTTIEEALQNRIPVLLYGGDGRYSHIPAFEVKGGPVPVERCAAYHVSAPHELLPALKGILRLGIDGQGRDKGLFDRFIYPERERIQLEKIIDEASR